MPLLEQRRRSSPAPAHGRFRLIHLFITACRHSVRQWTITWSLIFIAGFSLGGQAPLILSSRFSDASLWARIAAAAPLGLALGGSWTAVPVWAAVLGGSFLSGSLEASARQGRPTATVARPWSTAVPLAWSGAAILRITGWATRRDDGTWRAPARLMHPDASPLARKIGLITPGQGVSVSGQGMPPAPGAVVTGAIELKPPPEAALPGAFDYRRFLGGRSLFWMGRLTRWREIVPGDPVTATGRRIFSPMRQAVIQSLDHLLPAREAAVAKGVLLGQRDSSGRRASRPFADLGLAHLFAVSGLHVGILMGIFVLPGRVGGLGPWPRVVPLIILLGIYVLLTGMPGSVVRAAGLGTGALLAAPLGRKNRPLALVGLLFWAGIVWEPAQVLDTGVRLSYFAAGGILAVSGLTRQFRWTAGRMRGLAAAGLAVSLAAQWFTLPFVADSFGRISPVSPLANLLVVPLFGLAIWATVLALLTAGIFPWAAEALAGWAWVLMRSLSAGVSLVSGPAAGWPVGLPVPGTAAVVAWSLLTALMLVVLRARGKGRLSGLRTLGLIAGMVTAGVVVMGPASWQLNRPDRVTVWQFDAGQGDCGLLVFPDGWSALIDTGGRFGTGQDGPLARTILPFLRRHRSGRFGAGVLTHGHRDHTGGAALLAEAGLVVNWHYSGNAAAAVRTFADSSRIIRPEPGHVLHRWQEWSLRVVHPPDPPAGELHENDHSLVLELRQGQRARMVWSGDLEREGEAQWLAAGNAPEGTDVWKAGHHGSNTSGTRELVERLDPGLIVISCGLGNRYGHPNHGPYLAGNDTLPIVRTDLDGSIRLEWDRQGRIRWESRTKCGP